VRIEPSKMVVDILPFFGGRKAVTVGRKGLMKEGKTKQGKKSRITTQSKQGNYFEENQTQTSSLLRGEHLKQGWSEEREDREERMKEGGKTHTNDRMK
jgi:hypothetical protein